MIGKKRTRQRFQGDMRHQDGLRESSEGPTAGLPATITTAGEKLYSNPDIKWLKLSSCCCSVAAETSMRTAARASSSALYTGRVSKFDTAAI